MLDSVFVNGVITFSGIALSTGASLLLGLVVALVYMFRNTYSRSFVTTLALLPALVQTVIFLVNGNLGAGVAVMGAFGLIRFRSVPGTAREIVSIFFAMAIGIATGMGYIAYAGLFTLVVGLVMLLYNALPERTQPKTLRILVPEDMDYTHLFDDIFARFTKSAVLDRVKTTNMGSLFELQYTIEPLEGGPEKAMIDEIRKRNGNLTIVCQTKMNLREEL